MDRLYHIFKEISMLKKFFLIFFTFLIAFSVFVVPLSVSAYEVTGFDINAKAGMLISLDTGKVLYENNTRAIERKTDRKFLCVKDIRR